MAVFTQPANYADHSIIGGLGKNSLYGFMTGLTRFSVSLFPKPRLWRVKQFPPILAYNYKIYGVLPALRVEEQGQVLPFAYRWIGPVIL